MYVLKLLVYYANFKIFTFVWLIRFQCLKRIGNRTKVDLLKKVIRVCSFFFFFTDQDETVTLSLKMTAWLVSF